MFALSRSTCRLLKLNDVFVTFGSLIACHMLQRLQALHTNAKAVEGTARSCLGHRTKCICCLNVVIVPNATMMLVSCGQAIVNSRLLVACRVAGSPDILIFWGGSLKQQTVKVNKIVQLGRIVLFAFSCHI
jgi:hypothetical protein